MALTMFEEGASSLDPQKAFYLPVGAASPLWLMFAGAASAGVAYWWMTRWADRANLEALFTAPRSAPAESDLAAVAEVVAMEPPVAAAEAVEAVALQATAASVEAADIVQEALSAEVEPAPKTRTRVRPPGEPSSEA